VPQRSILLRIPLSELSGYGNDGIGIATHLTQMGLDVHVWPTVVEPPISSTVALLLTKQPLHHYDFMLHHVDPGILGMKPEEETLADVSVAWTMWEFDAFGPQEWEPKLAEALYSYDVLVAYDTLTRDLLKQYSHEGQRIETLQGGYEPAFWERDVDMRGGTFRYGMVGQLHNRKNPWAAINAFKSLKDEHGDAFAAELHLKTTVKSLHPKMEEWCPGLFIHYEVWDPEQLKAFYSGLDVLVAPSWGEGKNLPALEVGTLGVPTIASECSGHLMWADEAWTYLVPGEMQEVAEGRRGMVIDQDALREQMWWCYQHRGDVRERGIRAAQAFPKMRAWPVVLERMLQIMETT
jgi:glycosyltransferase involved in cell wall biosynthesis